MKYTPNPDINPYDLVPFAIVKSIDGRQCMGRSPDENNHYIGDI